MVRAMRGLNLTIAAGLVLATATAATAQAPSPNCQGLVAQLAALDRGDSDPGRADQIRRAEDAVHRQQYEVDRMVSQARQMGCERSGFFSIFSNPPPQCGGLNRQIDQARNALDRLQMQLEQSQGGNTERAAQRQSLLIALGNNNCGPQYRSAAQQGQQGGFFDRLFGGLGNENGAIIGAPQQQMGGTYRTVCVRLCDGYYFPISFATTPDRFQQDAQTCQRECPAAQVQLYSYHNPGEEMTQAVGLDGQPYSALPTAFAYRKQMSPACGCRRPGESWAEALKALGPDNTVEQGDVVVTEQNAKKLSLPRGADGKLLRPSVTPQPDSRSALADAPGQTDPGKRKVRTVGPTFLPSN
jgi:hypothetical protein